MKKRIFPPEGARINLGLCVVLALFLLSAAALLPRMGAERASRNAGIVLDFRDVASLAASTGRNAEGAWGEMAG